MRLILSISTVFLFLCVAACAQAPTIPNKDLQIATAVMALQEGDRAGAMVYGYDSEGTLVKLREGTNKMVCLADNPNQEGFQIASYHINLEPFMARGRALKAEGKNPKEVFDTREKEAKDGSLKMPDTPSTLQLVYGKEGTYNAETGELENTNYRSVVYIPWATAESTGLPLEPIIPGAAWLMDPGTHRAHIMITPPQ
ncbi:MAG: hypothetical protein AAF696_26090 [Bacteroidota bacterium]